MTLMTEQGKTFEVIGYTLHKTLAIGETDLFDQHVFSGRGFLRQLDAVSREHVDADIVLVPGRQEEGSYHIYFKPNGVSK